MKMNKTLLFGALTAVLSVSPICTLTSCGGSSNKLAEKIAGDAIDQMSSEELGKALKNQILEFDDVVNGTTKHITILFNKDSTYKMSVEDATDVNGTFHSDVDASSHIINATLMDPSNSGTPKYILNTKATASPVKPYYNFAVNSLTTGDGKAIQGATMRYYK